MDFAILQHRPAIHSLCKTHSIMNLSKFQKMKTRIFVAFFLLLASLAGQGATSGKKTIEGLWYGRMIVSDRMQLQIAFHITRYGNEYAAEMHSITQKQYRIRVKDVTFSGDTLHLRIPSLNAHYSGVLGDDGTLTGSLRQGRQAPWQLNMSPIDELPEGMPNRPQEPHGRCQYFTEDVVFNNSSAGIELAGTFTRPNQSGRYPAVVFVSGSGPTDRDATAFGHKFFLVLADYLTRHGIAVLRIDDRGVGDSKGRFSTATMPDLATDANAAVDYLITRSDVNSDRVGLLGHSLGADIAPIATSTNPNVTFLVLMAGSAVPLYQGIVEQCRSIFAKRGASQQAIGINEMLLDVAFLTLREETDDSLIYAKLNNRLKTLEPLVALLDTAEARKVDIGLPLNARDFGKLLIKGNRYDLFHDPAKVLHNVKTPVLILQGDADIQVLPHNARMIYDELIKSGNQHVTLEMIERANHLFQKCTKCSVEEYGILETTIEEEVMQTVVRWVNENTQH